MGKNKAPHKGLNTEQNNGLTDAQEVLYAKEFKQAARVENEFRQGRQNRNK